MTLDGYKSPWGVLLGLTGSKVSFRWGLMEPCAFKQDNDRGVHVFKKVFLMLGLVCCRLCKD